jgi:hypothetical protein
MQRRPVLGLTQATASSTARILHAPQQLLESGCQRLLFVWHSQRAILSSQPPLHTAQNHPSSAPAGPESVGASEGFLGWVAYLGAANAGVPLSIIVKQ